MSSGFGIYVHTPWCRTRCPYCAFNVFIDDKADYSRWRDAILTGWRAIAHRLPGAAHSLYFGGGTPSLAPPAIIGSIIDALPLAADAEVTLEANPGTIDVAGLQCLHSTGVNRLSLGVQTFDHDHARRLGRGHTAVQAKALLEQVQSLDFRSWSMDLIFALSGQTLDQLNTDLDQLISIAPPHVSLYGLSIEPDTAFAHAQAAGKLPLPEPDAWRDMYDRIVTVLEDNDLKRYEVSNFARPEHRAVHNEQVWRGGHYAGLGPGAHGFLPDGTRTFGRADLKAWLEDPSPEESHPEPLDTAADYLLSTLRHTLGVDRTVLRTRSGHDVAQADIDTLTAQKMIVASEERIVLTTTAFPISDGITRKLIGGLQPI